MSWLLWLSPASVPVVFSGFGYSEDAETEAQFAF